MEPATLRELALGTAWGMNEDTDREMDDKVYEFWAAKTWIDASSRCVRAVSAIEADKAFRAKYGERPKGLRVL
jgi:hypothetical protein